MVQKVAFEISDNLIQASSSYAGLSVVGRVKKEEKMPKSRKKVGILLYKSRKIPVIYNQIYEPKCMWACQGQIQDLVMGSSKFFHLFLPMKHSGVAQTK